MTSLGRIICDNSDEITQVFSNVFKRQGQVLMECSEILGMSLNPWHECQQENTGMHFLSLH